MSTPSAVAHKNQKTDDDIRKFFLELVQEPERAMECLTDLHQRLAAVDTKSATEAIDTAKGESDAMRKRNEILLKYGWDHITNPNGKRQKNVGSVQFWTDKKGNIIIEELESSIDPIQ
jgi:hypothetical protein